MSQFTIDHRVWTAAAHTIGGLAAGLFLWRGRRLDVRLTRAATVHVFLGVWFAVLGTGHLVAVTMKSFSRTLSSQSEPFSLILLGLAITLPGLLMCLGAAGIAAGQSDSCRTAAAADLWLAALLGFAIPPLALAPVAALLLLLYLPVAWRPPVLIEAYRWIWERGKNIRRKCFSR